MKRIILLVFVFILLSVMVNGAVVVNLTFDTADGIYNSTYAADLGEYNWTVEGATYGTGYIGQGYAFDGDDYLNRSISNLNIANTFTIGLWMKRDTDSGTLTLVEARRSIGGSNNIVMMRIIAGSVDKVEAVVYNNSGNNKYKQYRGNTVLQENTWYHLTMVWNGTGLELYVNGNQDKPYNVIQNDNVTVANITRNTGIGVSPSTYSTNYFGGNLDEVIVLDEALNATEVLAIYNQQNQGGIGLFDCRIKGNNTLTINLRNMSSNAYLTTDIQGSFNYTINNTDGYFAFEDTTTKYEVCIFESDMNASGTDYHLYYTYDDTSFTYFAENITLDNDTTILDLYVTDGTTQVLFNVKDTTGTDIEDAYIIIDKFDIGTNTYKTSEVLRTDTQGNAVGNIVLNTAWYRITIRVNNVIRLTDGPTIFTTNTKNYRISLDDDYYDLYSDYLSLSYNLAFNTTTRNFRFTFVDSNQVSDYVCLKVEKLNASGNTLINTSCTTSFSGTILLNIGPNYNYSRYLGTAYVSVDDVEFIMDVLEHDYKVDWRTFDDSGEGHGVFVALLIVLSFFMIGSVIHPIGAILLMLVGVVVSVLLGVYQMSMPMLMTLIILGAISIWRVNSAR